MRLKLATPVRALNLLSSFEMRWRNGALVKNGGCRLVAMLLLAVSSLAQTVVPWPEADSLFRSDPLWLGADAAFSVDLGRGRVLWLFGDSFVASKSAETRVCRL